MTKTTKWNWSAWVIAVLATFEDEPLIEVEEIAAGHETVRVSLITDQDLMTAYRVAAAIGAFAGTVLS